MTITSYPKGFKSGEKYIRSLLWKYNEQYPQFSREQIELPITLIINTISGLIDEFEDDYEMAQININLMKQFLNPKYLGDDINQASSIGELYLYSAGKDDVRGLAEENFSEQKKTKYLNFISEMTKEVIKDVCGETEKLIPFTEKVKYKGQSEISNIDQYNKDGGKERTFVEKLNKSNQTNPGAHPSSAHISKKLKVKHDQIQNSSSNS